MTFVVREYALVFRRETSAERSPSKARWSVERPRYRSSLPATPTAPAASARRVLGRRSTAELLVVPVCSTLALDTPSYESFLRSSGVLDSALELLDGVALADSAAVETVRRRIHSLVMAAEVQHIVDRLSA